jgi:hypothetical protein
VEAAVVWRSESEGRGARVASPSCCRSSARQGHGVGSLRS